MFPPETDNEWYRRLDGKTTYRTTTSTNHWHKYSNISLPHSWRSMVRWDLQQFHQRSISLSIICPGTISCTTSTERLIFQNAFESEQFWYPNIPTILHFRHYTEAISVDTNSTPWGFRKFDSYLRTLYTIFLPDEQLFRKLLEDTSCKDQSIATIGSNNMTTHNF